MPERLGHTNANIHPDILGVGTLLCGGKYRIGRHIASGGFGHTYEAVNVQLNTTCAVKEFFIKGDNHREPDSITVCVSNAENEELFSRLKDKFRKEAKRLSAINDEHVVRVFDLFDDNNTVYYVMDLIKGKTLEELLEQTKVPFSENQAIDILYQMLHALDVVHQAELWHMDIKPSNIIMDGNGKCTLIDFGACKQADQADGAYTTSSIVAYSPGYAPTEQISGNRSRWGKWTDYFALGATTYHLLTRKRPPLSEDIMVEGEGAFEYPDHVSGGMRRLILWMMEPLYTNRPASSEQIRKRLFEIQNTDYPNNGAQEPQLDISNDAEDNFHPKTSDTLSRGHGNVPAIPVGGNPNQSQINQLPATPKAKSAGKKKKKRAGVKWGIAAFILSLFAAGIVAYWFLANKSEEGKILTFDVNGVKFNMVKVEETEFAIGRNEMGEQLPDSVGYRVGLSPYYIATTEVTQQLWETVMGNNPSAMGGENQPVEMVSWDDCWAFIQKIDSITGLEFRFPTEAEWEYAAKGGRSSEGFRYAGANVIDSVAWYDANTSAESNGWTEVKVHREVMTKQPNELGIYDMTGNVAEWCFDRYGEYPETGKAVNPIGPQTGWTRVVRGGGAASRSVEAKVTDRNQAIREFKSPNIGLRLAMNAAAKPLTETPTDPDEINREGERAFYGMGTHRNLKKAFQLFQKGAEKNHPHAMRNQAACYYWGHGVEADRDLAALLYEAAAEKGATGAKRAVALCYGRGIGFQRDDAKAFYWFQQAANDGDPYAQAYLAAYYYRGIGTVHDWHLARMWYEKAAKQGYAPAQFITALFYENGIDVERNLKMAENWLVKAAGQGFDKATQELENIVGEEE